MTVGLQESAIVLRAASAFQEQHLHPTVYHLLPNAQGC